MIEPNSFVIPTHPYFTLPLAALPTLRDSKDPQETASKLIDLAIVRMADLYAGKYTQFQMETIRCASSGRRIEHWREENNCPGVELPHIAMACMALRVTSGCLSAIKPSADIVRWEIEKAVNVSNFATNVFFSVQARDLWDLTNGDMPLKDFLVLAAIRSIIGSSPKKAAPRRITREQIAIRIGGYSKRTDIIPQRRKMLLEEKKLKRIGRTADKLAIQERFTRWTGFRRETYYHVSMSESEIADYVSEKKSKANQRQIEGLKADLKCAENLQGQRDEIQALKDQLSKKK